MQMFIAIVPDSIQNVSTVHILDTFRRFKTDVSYRSDIVFLAGLLSRGFAHREEE